ncbi:MAG: flagellar type III secretion system pore protein FliP [Bacteriovoracaceae bacterium]
MKSIGLFLLTLLGFWIPTELWAQTGNMSLPGVSVNFGTGADLTNSLQLVGMLTILTLAPAILILCTCFTRIIVVLSFLRQAIGTANMPPNQLLIGFSLFLTVFIMKPTGTAIYNNAIQPYLDKKITSKQALQGIEVGLRGFMTRQVRKSDIGLFYDVTGEKAPATVKDVPLYFLVPAFIISELKTAFQIGFLLYIPFLILDMIVASVLMAMGMMMLPPVVISLPFKLLLFVLVDGWQLITGSILRSFN